MKYSVYERQVNIMNNTYYLKIKDSYYDDYPNAMEFLDSRFWGKGDTVVALLEACLKNLPMKVDSRDHAIIAITDVTNKLHGRPSETGSAKVLRVNKRKDNRKKSSSKSVPASSEFEGLTVTSKSFPEAEPDFE